MKLKTTVKQAATPKARALIFRSALASAAVPTTPAAIARVEDVSEALVSRVLQWRTFGGPKARAVQEHVARCLQEPVADLFPQRGPAIAGGGFQAQRRNWTK